MLKSWPTSRRLALGVLLLAGILALVVSGTSGSSGSGAASSARGGNAAASGSASSASSASGADSSASTASGVSAAGSSTPVPLQSEVTNTQNLKAGDAVTVDVKADAGQLIYAVEMRMCRGDAPVRIDGDMLPTVTGFCASQPLSSGADGFSIVQGAPPWEAMTAQYRVGVGSDRYQMDDGTEATVTCGPQNPCLLAIKYQYNGGFGVRTYPLTFAA